MSSKVAALYIRVSTEDQTELSPDAQKRLLLDYAQKNDMIVSGDFIFTESVSGRHAQKRPEFQKMIALAKQPSHPIDVILVWKFSRFARNQEESIVYKSMLKKDNVDVISVSEPLIEGPFGSLIERIIEWMDEYYSIRLSGEVLRGMKEKALQKGYQTSPCLGYTAVGHGKPYVINEAEYAIVSYIMDLYDNQNLDETAIARRCNDLGYRTKRGKLFERRSVDRILGNPFYCGTVVWNGVEFEGSHEVRLSRERYEKRQKLITSRKRPVKARNVSACKHWLSGLLKCSVCGATLSYTGNNKCPYFQCWKYAKGFHKTSVALSVKKAEEAVISYFDQILDGAEFTYVCKKKKTDHSLQIEQLQREISKLTMRESRIKEAYEAGVDTLEEYKNNKDRLVSDRLELTAALSQLLQEEQAEQPDTEEILKEIRSVADVLKNPDIGYEAKGNLIRSVVEQIIYYRVLHSGGPDGEIGASLRYLSQRFTMPNRTTSALLNDIGTEELSHLEMVSTIVHQLTRDLSMEEIEKSGFGPYYIDHTVGVWPQAAGGIPFNACEFQSKGDPITDLFEDLAAEQKARSTYDNILRVVRNIPEIADPIKFLRAREVVHFQRFGEALQSIQEELDAKNFYAFTPGFDNPCTASCNSNK